MNKQQALEEILTECRRHERPDGHKDVGSLRALAELVQLAQYINEESLAESGINERVRQMLAELGGWVLYLLANEVELVVGVDLDEWLAQRGPSGSGGSSELPKREPVPVNGAMMHQPGVVLTIVDQPRVDTGLAQEAYLRGVRDGGGAGRRA